jgi:polyisoprenoid-binding protein YceI
MSTLVNSSHRLSTRDAAWQLSTRSTFELTVKPRSGPIRVAGSIRLIDGLFQIDSAGEISIAVTVDTAGLVIHGERRDPRLRSHRFPDLAGHAFVRFESTRVSDDGTGLLHVTGVLAAGTKRVPLEFLARVMNTDGSLELSATAVVNHRRLGLVWVPAGPLKVPTELVIRTRLIPVTADERASTTARRRRRPLAINSRYHVMGRRPASATGH